MADIDERTDPAAPAAARSVLSSRRQQIVLGGVLLVVALVVYLAVTLTLAAVHLHRAQHTLRALRADVDLTSVPEGTLDSDLASAQHETAAAHRDTSGPVWALAAHVPLVGRPFAAVRGGSTLANDLAHDAGPRIVQLDQLVHEATAPGGLKLAPLSQASGPLQDLAVDLRHSVAQARALPTTHIGPLDSAVRKLDDQLTNIQAELGTAAQTAKVAPAMLGGSGTRRYFVAFENEAESRGLGGLPGAFGIVRADDGKVSFEHFGSDDELVGVRADVPLSPDLQAEYAGDDPTGEYRNSDLSPNFPDAAQIWVGMWAAHTKQTTGTAQQLDGALAIDPTALSALLRVTGPASLPDGTKVTADDVVQLTEQKAYGAFDTEKARKAYLLALAKASANKIADSGQSQPAKLATAAGRMAGERRILLWSAHPEEQAVFAGQPIAGLLAPTSGPQANTGPYLMVDVSNIAGNKVDYWLERRIAWTAGGCTGKTRDSVVTVVLTNEAPAGLSDYVGGRSDDHAGDGSPLGTSRLLVEVRPTVGSGFSSATLDGKPVSLAAFTEQGRPSFQVDMEVQPGQSRTLVVHLTEPTVPGQATMVDQPLVNDPDTFTDVPRC